MSRWKAAAIHLGLSVSLVLLLAGALALTWYPPEYVWAVGGLGLMGILAGVDACLGPLLTLVVFDTRKPSLKFDLAVIAALQLSALSYGLHAVYLARPVYLVFTVDRFDLVTAADIPPENLQGRSLPLTGPEIVAAKPPEDPNERRRILFSALSGGADLQQFPQYYAPYPDLAALALAKALPVESLMNRAPEYRQRLQSFLDAQQRLPTTVKYLPLRAKMHDQAVVLDGSDGKVLGIVNLAPW